MSEKFLKFMFGFVQHVQDAAVSGFVHSLVGGDEHSQVTRAPKGGRRPAVINQRQEAVVFFILSQNLSDRHTSKPFITRRLVRKSVCDWPVDDVDDPIGCWQVLLDDVVQSAGVVHQDEPLVVFAPPPRSSEQVEISSLQSLVEVLTQDQMVFTHQLFINTTQRRFQQGDESCEGSFVTQQQ